MEIQLDDRYWDCECDTDYIHHRFQSYCKLCDTDRDESPSARVNEILQFYFVPGKEVIFKTRKGVVVSTDVEKQMIKINFGNEIQDIPYFDYST